MWEGTAYFWVDRIGRRELRHVGERGSRVLVVLLVEICSVWTSAPTINGSWVGDAESPSRYTTTWSPYEVMASKRTP